MFFKDPDVEIGKAKTLSAIDVKKINRMYRQE